MSELLRHMQPLLHDGVFAFSMAPPGFDVGRPEVVATFRETEGTSVVLAEAAALALGLPVLFRAAWITLEVHSDLHAVGLTAAVAGELTEAGIACNVVAAARHDHLFVPVERAREALRRLRALQARAAGAC